MTRAGDPDDPPDADAPWILTLTHEDGTVEISTIEPSKPTNEPFNHDGFWKAVLVAPEDGRLYCVPLLAITAEVVEAPPPSSSGSTTPRRVQGRPRVHLRHGHGGGRGHRVPGRRQGLRRGYRGVEGRLRPRATG